MKTVKLYRISQKSLGEVINLGVTCAVSEAQARQFFQSYAGTSNAETKDLIVEYLREEPRFMQEVKSEVYIYDSTLGGMKKLFADLVKQHGTQAEFRVKDVYPAWGDGDRTTEYWVVSKRPIDFQKLKKEAKAMLSQGLTGA